MKQLFGLSTPELTDRDYGADAVLGSKVSTSGNVTTICLFAMLLPARDVQPNLNECQDGSSEPIEGLTEPVPDSEACHQIAKNTLQTRKRPTKTLGFEAQFTADLAKHGVQKSNFNVATAAALNSMISKAHCCVRIEQ